MAVPGLPRSLVQTANPIIEKALETGARGSTSKTTNYGVVGDAMFKKAQLDLQMASLVADVGMRQAELTSGLAMDAAQLDQNMIFKRMDYDVALRELEMQMKENEVGFFEGLFNTVSGAVEGAVAGSLIPGVGTVAGAVAGGASTAAGTIGGGRKGMTAARNMVGTVAQGAQILDGIGRQKKADKNWESIRKTGENLVNELLKPDLSQEERMAKQLELDQHIGNASKFLTEQRLQNPEISADLAADYGKELRRAGGLPVDETESALATANMRRAVEAASDPRFDDPATVEEALTDLSADLSANYMLAKNKDKIPQPVLDSYMDKAGLTNKPAVQEYLGIPSGGQSGGATQALPAPSSGPAPRSDVAGRQITTDDMVASKRRRAVQQPGQAREEYGPAAPGSIGHRGVAKPLGPSVEMDDGAEFQVTEKDLLEQGAKTAEIMAKQDSKAPVGVASEDQMNERADELRSELGELKKQHRSGKISEQEYVKRGEAIYHKLDQMGEDVKEYSMLDHISGKSTIDKGIDAITKDDPLESQIKHEKKLKSLKGDKAEDVKQNEIARQRIKEERDTRYPGVQDKVVQDVEALKAVKPQTENMPTEKVHHANLKRALDDGSDAIIRMSEINETLPDDVQAMLTEEFSKEGVDISSMHFDSEAFTKVTRVLADKVAEGELTDKQRDDVLEYYDAALEVSYADMQLINPRRSVKESEARANMKTLPGLTDNFRTRSKKLRLLAHGFKIAIDSATTGKGFDRAMEKEDLDVENARLTNQKLKKDLGGDQGGSLNHWITQQKKKKH